MIEKLTDDRNKARRGLESETTETLTSQIELEKLAEEFKRAHSDRQGTILKAQNSTQGSAENLVLGPTGSGFDNSKFEIFIRRPNFGQKSDFFWNFPP